MKLIITFLKNQKTTNRIIGSIQFYLRTKRDEFLEITNSNGMTRPIWLLMNTLPMYKDKQNYSLHNSKWLRDRVVNIPSSVKFK